MYNNRMRNLEIPENLFSNLGVGDFNNKRLNFDNYEPERDFYSSKDEIIPNEVNPKIEVSLKSEVSPKNEIKLVNYDMKNEYRDRINRMYNEIDVKPIDGEIEDTLYFDNYVEKGIVVKPKVSSLKQFWTEYRLINNEKHGIKILDKNSAEFASFDDLFEALSSRITEINNYIDELKEMKANIVSTTNKLEQDKEKLSNERREFNSYREKEENKLKQEKENLKINFSKLQTIIDDLDKKLGDLDK